MTDNLPAVQAEIAELQGMMGDRGSLYWKDESYQVRLRELYETRDGGGEAETVEDSAAVSAELAPVSFQEFTAAMPDGDYLAYLAIARDVADVALGVPPNERPSLVASFNELPDEVTAAIALELSNRQGTGLEYCSDAEVRKFAGETGGRVVREWGAEAQVKMARVRARLNRCMDLMDARGLDAFLDWHESLTDGQAAAVYRKLAA